MNYEQADSLEEEFLSFAKEKNIHTNISNFISWLESVKKLKICKVI